MNSMQFCLHLFLGSCKQQNVISVQYEVEGREPVRGIPPRPLQNEAVQVPVKDSSKKFC